MADEFVSPPPGYTPEGLAAIREARASLYEAAAARRLRYLQTGRWTPQLAMPPAVPRDGEDPPPVPPPAALVDHRRGVLDEARAAARPGK